MVEAYWSNVQLIVVVVVVVVVVIQDARLPASVT